MDKVELYDIVKSKYIKQWNFNYLPREGDNISIGEINYRCEGIRFYNDFIRIWVVEL